MAGNRIDVELSVNDNAGSLKKRNAEAKELNQNLTSAARMAEKAMKPVASKYQAAGEGTEYGRARGSMGSTGASARDFANQAQGLGGLVRVYATVAANLFAVSAAFNALKEAANTTNMIKGLDQLGAASGVALGSLSKRLVEATDGAISLREAVSTVAKSSAAGLSSKQIIEIGQYAKVASQALGLDMTDAISRLTRGITKLEPELLDELGLFTKIGPATEKYALKLGKSAASLTDFERRQAFANAVLEEAREKFSELDVGANPYQKLEAGIRNLASSGLQLVNGVLVPIVNLFSNNQAALTVGLGLIATKLTTMAIPALIGWRSELVRAAKEAKDKSKEITEAFGEKFTERTGIKLNIPQLQQNLDDAKKRVTKAQQDLLDAQKQYGMRATKTTAAAAAGTFGQDPKDFSRAQAQIASLMDKNTPKSLAQAAALKALVDETRNLTSAQNNLNKAFETQDKYASGGDLGEWLRRRASKVAASRAERLTILSEISADTEAGGFGYAIDKMNEKIRKSTDMGIFAKLRTQITGTFAAGVASIGVFTRALGNIGAIIAGVTTIATLLKTTFTKNAQEAELFGSAITTSSEAVKTSIGVIDKYADSISTASLAAKANNIRELGMAVDQLADSFEKATKKAGVFDKAWEGLLDILPFVNSQFEDFSSSIGSNLAQQLNMIPEGPAKNALKDKLTSILSSEDLTKEGIAAAVKKAGKSKAPGIVEAANAVLLADRNKIEETGVKAQEFAERIKSANLEASKLIQSLANTDPLSRFGESLVRMGADFQEASKDVQLSVATLKETLKDPKSLALVSPESIAQLKQIQETLPKLSNTLASGNAELAKVRSEVDTLQAQANKFKPGVLVKVEDTATGRALAAAKTKERSLAEEVNKSQTEIEKLQRELRKIAVLAIEEGYKLMQSAAARAVRQGGIDLQKSLLQGVSSPEVTSAQAELDRQSLAIQREQITETSRLAETMLKSNALSEARLAWDQAQSMRQEAKDRGGVIDASTQERIDYLVKKSGELSLLGTTGSLKGSALQQKDLTTEAQGVNLQLLTARQGTAVKLAENNAKVAISKQQEALQVAAELRAIDNDRQATLDKIQDISREITLVQLSSRDILHDSEISTRNQLQLDQQIRSQAAARKTIEDQISSVQDRIVLASGKELTALLASEKRLESKLGLLGDQQEAEKRLLALQQRQADIANLYAMQKRELELINDKKRIDLDNAAKLNASERELINKKLELGMIDERSVYYADLELERQALLMQADTDRFNAKAAYDSKLIELAKQLAQAGSTPEAIADYNRLAVEASNNYNAQIGAINTINQRKLEGLSLDQKLGFEGKQYAKVLSSIPDGLTDAFMKFAETGKLSFKDLTNSIIADLARIAIKTQMTNLMSNLFGNGFAASGGSFLSTLFGNTAATAATPFVGPLLPSQMPPLPFAKGAMFDTGVQKFAKGGAFTNNIVNTPTLFKFADGAGLMGEAGPEAIMPLKRDSSGSLGVVAQGTQPKVDVVVNNFSNAQATTRETTDSRGNRKIEVVIGEMVAGEMARTGSTLQQSMQANFNSRPAVARR